MASSNVEPAIIVGGGRVGGALMDMGNGDDVLVKRGDAIPMTPPGPIFVCTRNDALDAIIDACPQERKGDLVFLQNGMLQPFLDARGLGDNTQALMYFAVAKMGEAPVDGKTDVNPEGLTAACGKWADALRTRLAVADCTCKVLDRESFTVCMLEKLMWIAAFMLVGARHDGCTVGEVESRHTEEVRTLIEEMIAGLTATQQGVAFDEGTVARLMSYARAVAHFPTAVKELEWRNGFFYDISTAQTAVGKPDPFPTHTAWLKEVGAV